MIDFDRLRRQIEETLADQDYYGHPSISLMPGPATRQALTDAIMNDVIDAFDEKEENRS